MTNLSPAAQAVFHAFNSKFDWIEDGVPGPQFNAIAAALRAAAEQLVPQVYLPERFYSGEDFEEYARQMTRQHLLAIADELDNEAPIRHRNQRPTPQGYGSHPLYRR
jgi:hypothetical protein